VIGLSPAQPDDRADLQRVREVVRRLPEVPFPDDALDEVWAETIDADRPVVARRSPWLSLGLAAAVMIAVAGALWTGAADDEVQMSEAEMARLENEVHEVLLLVSTALQRTERIDSMERRP
jgi:hypothetical protein